MRTTFLLRKDIAENLTSYERSRFRELNERNLDQEYLHNENSAKLINELLCEIASLRKKLPFERHIEGEGPPQPGDGD